MFIIISLIILVFIYPITIRAKVYVNLLKKKAIVSIRLYKIPLATLQLTMEDLNLIITNSKGAKLTANKQQQDFDFGFILTVLKFVLGVEMVNTFYGGINTDSFKASMLSASALILLELFKTQAKTFRKDFMITNSAESTFKEDVVVLTSDAFVSINIIRAILAFVVSLFKSFKKKGEKKYERRKTA